jgi:hypothetical protein
MNTIKDDAPDHGGVEVVATWTVSAWDCMNVARWFGRGVPLGHIPSTIRDLMLAGFCLLFAIGCGAAELPSPEVSARAAELSALLTSTQTVETKSDEILKVVESNTTALAAIKAKVDALQVVSNPNGKDGDPESAPESPAKANDTPNPLKVATPGTSSESLTELATRLYGQGVSVHMKTEDQLKAIDAQLNGGAPVTGAIFPNQRTSAVTSQRSSVRLIPRGKGVVRWQRNSAGQTCGPNGCN